ncbi:type I iodothyronine deiodinase-like [Hydractinia symbiolongicarpus]|uniref:type I iodothyronine deiodinase-like n=1 Tax=Hydractinia symbiolongicarpus TaxID=13093 RepID=UPI0025503105|nr:type I iodothyronine deiodinase-like [Hydractinia symbiolongicarpus]
MALNLKDFVIYQFHLVLFSIIFMIAKILSYVPGLKIFLGDCVAKMAGIENGSYFAGKNLFSSQMFFNVLYQLYLDGFKQAKFGLDAPDAVLYNQEGKQVKLLDFCDTGRPLVINFGSCS